MQGSHNSKNRELACMNSNRTPKNHITDSQGELREVPLLHDYVPDSCLRDTVLGTQSPDTILVHSGKKLRWDNSIRLDSSGSWDMGCTGHSRLLLTNPKSLWDWNLWRVIDDVNDDDDVSSMAMVKHIVITMFWISYCEEMF